MPLSSTVVIALSPAPLDLCPPPALQTEGPKLPYSALQWDHAPRTRCTRSKQGQAVPGTRGPEEPAVRPPDITCLNPYCPCPARWQTYSRPSTTKPPIGQAGFFSPHRDAAGRGRSPHRGTPCSPACRAPDHRWRRDRSRSPRAVSGARV